MFAEAVTSLLLERTLRFDNFKHPIAVVSGDHILPSIPSVPGVATILFHSVRFRQTVKRWKYVTVFGSLRSLQYRIAIPEIYDIYD